ncbi:MAG: single-stranded DNA-binding protein [Opitutales bacterium]
MASFNKVILIGNLTRDPETRQTQSGMMIAKFAIAVNRSFSGQDGASREEVCYVDIECFGRTAENVARFFSRGRPILVEGRLRQDSWEDKNTPGLKRTKMIVVLERFEFVGGRNDSDSSYSSNSYESSSPSVRQAPAPSRANDTADDLEDDDVPF